MRKNGWKERVMDKKKHRGYGGSYQKKDRSNERKRVIRHRKVEALTELQREFKQTGSFLPDSSVLASRFYYKVNKQSL